MKKPQWITLLTGLCLVAVIYFFGKIVPPKKIVAASPNAAQNYLSDITTDSILSLAKKNLTPEQVIRLNTLENSVSRGDVKDQQLRVYHNLVQFWHDSARIFEPYAWYLAQAARLENSEKSLTFAAHLFLENLQLDNDPRQIKWKALQAKDLFERSLKINPENDSARIGLGACYLFGNISATPMEGIAMIRKETEKDSSNVFAQMMLVKGSVISGQYDKAIPRLQTINRLEPGNVEAIIMLADVYERNGDKSNAITWYQKSLEYIRREDARAEIENRIQQLKK